MRTYTYLWSELLWGTWSRGLAGERMRREKEGVCLDGGGGGVSLSVGGLGSREGGGGGGEGGGGRLGCGGCVLR